ncbi:MAG: DUF5908 family protein [Pseudomonadota bacterium]
MPIEIRELHIKVAVTAPPGQGGTPAGAPQAEGGQSQDAIVAECVEQVLRILQNRMER